jgi:hypothetical protein
VLENRVEGIRVLGKPSGRNQSARKTSRRNQSARKMSRRNQSARKSSRRNWSGWNRSCQKDLSPSAPSTHNPVVRVSSLLSISTSIALIPSLSSNHSLLFDQYGIETPETKTYTWYKLIETKQSVKRVSAMLSHSIPAHISNVPKSTFLPKG